MIPVDDAFLCNWVLLGQQMGGGLQRIQRGYKSHTRELPPGMQGASTINPCLSTTLTLTINTLLPLEQE